MTRPKKDRIGATRGKLVLVGVLGVALLLVWRGAMSDSSSSDATASGERAVGQETEGRPQKPGEGRRTSGEGSQSVLGKDERKADAVERPPAWPTLAISDVVAHDPLSSGDAVSAATEAPSDAARSQAAVLQRVREGRDAMVLLSGGHKVFRMGQKEYRVGDTFEGYQIRDITSSSLVLDSED